LSAAAGVVSLVTAAALARSLLPRGGGMLAALILAGLRWHLVVSRWGWNAIVLAPVADLAALLLLAGRRRGTLAPAALAGFRALAALAGWLAGLGDRTCLAAWVVAAALLLLAAWPREGGPALRPSIGPAVLYAAGFAIAVAPIFLFTEGRQGAYFARPVDHSLVAEIRYARSIMPGFTAAAGSLVAPGLLGGPSGHHDLPGQSPP